MPEEVDVRNRTSETKLSKSKKDFLTELRGAVFQDDEDRGIWKNKMIIATNQRLGVKRATDFPYPDAPNIPLPETDKLIKKSTPNLVLSAWAPKKMAVVRLKDGVQMTDQLKVKVKNAEMGLNLRLRSRDMDLFRKLALAADFAKQYGHTLFRVVKKFSSRVIHKVIDLDELQEGVEDELKALTAPELRQFVTQRFDLDPTDDDDKEIIDDVIEQFKSGTRVIEFDIEEVKSRPDIQVPLPTKIIVPSYTTDINHANRITFEYFLTREQMEQKMREGTFRDKDLDKINLSGIAKGDKNDLIEQQKDRNEGVTDNMADIDLFRIWETLTWWKESKKGRAKRWVFTTLADAFNNDEALLQDLQFPFEFSEDTWNYDKYDNEIKDHRYYASRGLPEQIRAIQEIMERSMNNMIIRDEMNNTPMWEVMDTSDIMDGHTRFVPGEKLPVKQIGAEIKRLNEPNNVDVSSDRIMQILKASAEEYVGSTDQLFRNATNAGGGKTLGEIKEGVKQTSGIINMEVIHWNNVLTSVYQKVFDIMRDSFEEDVFVDGVRITKEDFDFPAEVRSNGTLEVADKELSTIKAQNRLAIISQMREAGIVDAEDQFNALQDWLEKDGVKDPDMFSTDPKIILQTQLAQMQQQLQQMQQQAQGMQEVIQNDTKEVAKLQEQGKKIVAQTQGKVEANQGG